MKLPDAIQIAHDTGRSVRQVLGMPDAADRLQVCPHPNDAMRVTLTRFLELSDYLDDQAI